jgi:hypothetical protein
MSCSVKIKMQAAICIAVTAYLLTAIMMVEHDALLAYQWSKPLG